MPYRYKNELVFFDTIEKESLFYAPTLGICISGTSELIDKMKHFLTGEEAFPEFEQLLESGFSSRKAVYILGEVKSRYFHVALGLSENCTLSCVYCHADAGKNTLMTDDILLAVSGYAREKVINGKLKGINLSFAVGGEPTFEFNKLKYSIDLFRKIANECNVQLNTSMTTNGYYGREKAQYVAENINNILISIDGVKDVQNLHRPTRNMTESFDEVVNTMDVVYDIKKELNVRSTISNINIDSMKEFLDFLANRYSKNVTCVFEPLVPLGRGANCSNNGVFPPDQMRFAERFWEAYCYAETLGIKLKTSAMNADRLVSGFCGAMFIPSFTVTTNGIVTTCERDSTGQNYGYGKYDNEKNKFIIFEDKVKENQDRIVIPKCCDECICRYHCAGDCPDVRTIHYDRCDVNRYLLKKYLLHTFLKNSE